MPVIIDNTLKQPMYFDWDNDRVLFKLSTNVLAMAIRPDETVVIPPITRPAVLWKPTDIWAD